MLVVLICLPYRFSGSQAITHIFPLSLIGSRIMQASYISPISVITEYSTITELHYCYRQLVTSALDETLARYFRFSS